METLSLYQCAMQKIRQENMKIERKLSVNAQVMDEVNILKDHGSQAEQGGWGVTGNNTCKISFAPSKGSKYLYTAIFTFFSPRKG